MIQFTYFCHFSELKA